MWLGNVNDIMHGKRARRIWGILKKVSLLSFCGRTASWVPGSEEEGWLSLAHRSQASGLVAGATRVGVGLGGRGKSQDRKNVYLSPYVEKPFNSKVIKSFVPELRSRYVFFVFRDSYVLCIYVLNILCTFHTYPYHGYVTKISLYLEYSYMGHIGVENVEKFTFHYKYINQLIRLFS